MKLDADHDPAHLLVRRAAAAAAHPTALSQATKQQQVRFPFAVAVGTCMYVLTVHMYVHTYTSPVRVRCPRLNVAYPNLHANHTTEVSSPLPR